MIRKNCPAFKSSLKFSNIALICCIIAILQCCKIINIKNMNKEKMSEYFDENFDFFMSKLYDNYNPIIIGGDCASKDEVIIISKNDFKKRFGFIPCNFHFYESYRCGHDYDCCGCLSSLSLYISVCKNGYISIYLHSTFNY